MEVLQPARLIHLFPGAFATPNQAIRQPRNIGFLAIPRQTSIG